MAKKNYALTGDDYKVYGGDTVYYWSSNRLRILHLKKESKLSHNKESIKTTSLWFKDIRNAVNYGQNKLYEFYLQERTRINRYLKDPTQVLF